MAGNECRHLPNLSSLATITVDGQKMYVVMAIMDWYLFAFVFYVHAFSQPAENNEFFSREKIPNFGTTVLIK